MKFGGYILLAFVILVIVSCKDNNTEKDDNFIDLSTYCKNQYDSIIIPSLNIDNLILSDDQNEIRILEQSFVFRFGRLFIIKETTIGWKCFRYNYWHTSIDDVFSIKIDTFNVESIVPKSGWANFVNMMDSLKLCSFTDQSSIEGWKEKDISDGTYYLLDFNCNNKRVCYYYHCPELYPEYENSRQMTSLIKLLEKEVEFNSNRLPAAVELERTLKMKNKNELQ